MSKIGNKKITISKNIKFTFNLDLQQLKVTNMNENLKENFFKNLVIICENNEIFIYSLNENSKFVKFFGLCRSLIYNMIYGLIKKWSKLLIIDGIGYKFVLENNKLQIFAGFSHNVSIDIPKNITISLLSQSRVLLSGIHKSNLGLFASKIKAIKKPEPYGGKGIRYNFDILIKKIGKKEKKSKKIKK